MQLDPTAVAAGVRHIAHDTLDSTNAEALRLARSGERGPLWITAATQTAGRGRRGSHWVSAPGNLFATLLLADPAPPQQAPQLSFVAALAVHDAVSGCARETEPALTLKWPNDVLLSGRKLAGILIEGESVPAFAVAVGIGVNCTRHPDDTAYPATDLAAAGVSIGPDRLFAALSAAMRQRLTQWRRGEGFAAIRADWLARAASLGEEIRVRVADDERDGRFDGLDENGRLILRKAGGSTETIAAGEVFALPAGAR